MFVEWQIFNAHRKVIVLRTAGDPGDSCCTGKVAALCCIGIVKVVDLRAKVTVSA